MPFACNTSKKETQFENKSIQHKIFKIHLWILFNDVRKYTEGKENFIISCSEFIYLENIYNSGCVTKNILFGIFHHKKPRTSLHTSKKDGKQAHLRMIGGKCECLAWSICVRAWWLSSSIWSTVVWKRVHTSSGKPQRMKLDPLARAIVSHFSSMSKHLQTCLFVYRPFQLNVRKHFLMEWGKEWVHFQSLEEFKHKLSPTWLDIIEEIQASEVWLLVWFQLCEKSFNLSGTQFSVKWGSLTKLPPCSFWVLNCFDSALV